MPFIPKCPCDIPAEWWTLQSQNATSAVHMTVIRWRHEDAHPPFRQNRQKRTQYQQALGKWLERAKSKTSILCLGFPGRYRRLRSWARSPSGHTCWDPSPAPSRGTQNQKIGVLFRSATRDFADYSSPFWNWMRPSGRFHYDILTDGTWCWGRG